MIPSSAPAFPSKLANVGTTIFTVMSKMAEEHAAVNLGQGFPDFDPPAELCAALARHVAAGKNQYAPMAGVERLREQIAKQLERDYGRRLDAENEITVTSGATEAIFDAISAVVRPGDEVIVFDPCYDSYEPAVLLQGGRAVHLPLVGPEFHIDFDRLKAAVGARTRLVILNFPHNPSGAVLGSSDLDALALCLRGSNALVLADEVYEHIVFDGRAHASLLTHPELFERSFVVSSFGKSYHATGWKIGWAAAPKALSAELRKAHQFVTFSSFTAAQHAFADALEGDRGHLAGLASFYQTKRDHFRRLLAPSGFRLLPVAGAYFQLAEYGQLSSVDDVGFSRRLAREAGVVAIPVSVFCETAPATPLIRFCFAKNDATLEQAAARLVAFLR